MAQPITVTDSDFDEKVLKSDLPVLVDFWADWCMPCKMIAPIVEELSQEYDGKVDFAKLDVDSNPSTALTYGVKEHTYPPDFQGRPAGRPDSWCCTQGNAEKED